MGIELQAVADLYDTPWTKLLLHREALGRDYRDRVSADWDAEPGALAAAGYAPLARDESRQSLTVVVEFGPCLALLQQHRQGHLSVEIASGAVGSASAILDSLKERFKAPPAPPQDIVKVNFWMQGPMGARNVRRSIQAPAWDDVATNYDSGVRGAVEPLLGDFRPASGGRLILWHGPPGTGKTFAIRALAREWKSWCDIDYVTDPESFFGTASYMTDVLLQDDDSGPVYVGESGADKGRWRLVVLEDAGELMSADARLRTGQGLSRLLNVTDGMIGQGLRTLVLITTNEEATSLHSAVARPGRCLSNTHFGELSVVEATDWFAAQGVDAPAQRPATIAELYAALDETRILAPTEPKKVGFAA